MQSPSRLKDRIFYGWVIVITVFVISTIISGIRTSFGVFFKSLESEFNLTRAATSAILSTNMVLGCVFDVLGGWACDRYGPRMVILLMGLITGISLLLTSQANSAWQLFITYSLLLAMGTMPIFTVTVSTVSRWFDKKRGLVVGISSAGGGLGMVIMAPFATYLISNFGWRWAYIIIGVIAWVIVIPLSRLLKRSPDEIGLLPDGAKLDSRERQVPKPQTEESTPPAALTLSQASRTRSFWLLMFTHFFFATNHFLVITHLVPHVTDMGISAGQAATLLSLIGGVTIASMAIMGSVSDRIGRKTAVIVCSLVQTGSMVWLVWVQDLGMLYLFALVYGLTRGIPAIFGALIGDTFGLRQIGTLVGVLGIGIGIGAAFGPAIGGLIFDVSNSYSMAFIIGATAMLVVALLITLVRRETGRATSDIA